MSLSTELLVKSLVLCSLSPLVWLVRGRAKKQRRLNSLTNEKKLPPCCREPGRSSFQFRGNGIRTSLRFPKSYKHVVFPREVAHSHRSIRSTLLTNNHLCLQTNTLHSLTTSSWSLPSSHRHPAAQVAPLAHPASAQTMLIFLSCLMADGSGCPRLCFRPSWLSNRMSTPCTKHQKPCQMLG